MKEIKSIINSIVVELYNITDVDKIKEIFVKCITNSGIKEEDKKKMLIGIQEKDTYERTITYVYNCLLKYEGDGVVGLLKR